METWVSLRLGIRFTQVNGDHQRADQLVSQVRSAATNLLGLGLSSEQVATALGFPLDEVNAIGQSSQSSSL